MLVEILGQWRGIPRRNPMCSLRILLPESTTKLADFEHLSDIVSRYEAPSVITGHSVNDGGRNDIRIPVARTSQMVRKVCQRGRQKKVLLSARASSPYHFAAFDDLRYHVNSNNR